MSGIRGFTGGLLCKVFLFINTKLDSRNCEVECGQCQTHLPSDSRLPALGEPFFKENGFKVLDTSSEDSEKC